ncbi:MAG: SDR family oxidoreductase, partial [Clostridia bacterium]|nr:SDR family oxidoreductase [Clostridia bacterium]
EALGRRCVACVGDVRDDKAVTAAVEKTIAELGKIDILFNNAGICAYATVDGMTDEEWNAMIDINLKGPMNVTRRVAPYMMKAKEGVIINNSSVMGLRGGNRLSHYTASKWGLTGLTKAWAIELAPYNIRVVSIHPTGVNTPMNDGLAAMEGMTPREIAERSAGNLLPVPWVEPEDVANLVLWVASDKARYVTGSQLVLDAGLLSV